MRGLVFAILIYLNEDNKGKHTYKENKIPLGYYEKIFYKYSNKTNYCC